MVDSINRRKILKSGAAAATALSNVGVVTASSNDTLELPIDVVYEGTHVVDKKWYKLTQAADRVHENSNFLRHDGIHGQWVRPGGSEEGGHPRLEVEVEPNNEKAKRKIPDERDGVPVDTVERPKGINRGACASIAGKNYGTNPPGGAQIARDGSGGGGTMTPLMLDNNYPSRRYVGTSAHVAEVCEYSYAPQQMDHPTDGYDAVGDAYPSYAVDKLDFVAVRTDGEGIEPRPKVVDPQNPLESSSDQWYDINGTYTKSAVQAICNDTERNGETPGSVRKVGRTTCTTHGDAKGYGKKRTRVQGRGRRQLRQ
ncbi:hypothetical protein [Haloglomus salinum]|uniref:hypothetical protein n=1 Tax=Haloglomus salinum TaxID=2962673 RepID=UPI0020C9C28D|nr:hypothetical protein [Haloglomus salinum]